MLEPNNMEACWEDSVGKIFSSCEPKPIRKNTPQRAQQAASEHLILCLPPQVLHQKKQPLLVARPQPRSKAQFAAPTKLLMMEILPLTIPSSLHCRSSWGWLLMGIFPEAELKIPHTNARNHLLYVTTKGYLSWFFFFFFEKSWSWTDITDGNWSESGTQMRKQLKMRRAAVRTGKTKSNSKCLETILTL